MVLTISRMFINHTVWDLNAVFMYLEDVTGYFFYVKKVHVLVFVFFLTFLPWTSSVLRPRLFFPPKLDLILHLKFELLLAACDGDKIAAKYSIKCYYEKTHGTENISRKIETSIESLISLLLKVTIPSCSVWSERSTTPLVHLSVSR